MSLRAVLPLALLCVLACAALAQDGPVATRAAHDLLRASAPGAYSVRYLPDRALISSSTQQATELRVYVPNRPLWWYQDGEKQLEEALVWDDAASAVVLALDAGRHDLQVGWAGTGEQPRPGQKIPLLVDGEAAGELAATFTIHKMTAQGGAQIPAGVARVWLTLLDPTQDIEARLDVDDETIDEWREVAGRLQGRGHVGVGGDAQLCLTVPAYNLLSSPVKTVEVETVRRPVNVVRVDAMPEDGVLIEAEDFVAEGGGFEVGISEGDHLDQHGGKSIFSYRGDGHWLAWEFEVLEDGEYDLFAKIACAEDMSFREVRVDGRLPASRFELVQFPNTGGWAHSPGEWWYVQIAGGSPELPPLKLSAGRHTLRIEGVLKYHLNVDYFVVRPR